MMNVFTQIEIVRFCSITLDAITSIPGDFSDTIILYLTCQAHDHLKKNSMLSGKQLLTSFGDGEEPY